MSIKNAANTTLNKTPGTLPDLSGGMMNWFQKITFKLIIGQTVVNFRAVDEVEDKNFSGVIQPFTDQQLAIKATGERAWKWYTVHSDTTLDLKPGGKIIYQDTRYRVMSKANYTDYGYLKYEMVEDFQG